MTCRGRPEDVDHMGTRQQDRHPRGDDPTEHAADEPVALPRPVADLLERDVETPGREAPDRMQQTPSATIKRSLAWLLLQFLSQNERLKQPVFHTGVFAPGGGPVSGPRWNMPGQALPRPAPLWCGPSVFLSVPMTTTSMVFRPRLIWSVTSQSHGGATM